MTDAIRLHDLYEASVWVWDGGLPREDAEALVRDALATRFVAEGWEHGPVEVQALPREHPRVAGSGVFPPEQARHRNPYIITASARAMRRLPVQGSVVNDLTDEDLHRLRAVVRRRFGPLTDEQADAHIDAIVPKTVSQLVH